MMGQTRTPSKSHIQQARLLNVPEREVCVSAHIEEITARSYRFLNRYDDVVTEAGYINTKRSD